MFVTWMILHIVPFFLCLSHDFVVLAFATLKTAYPAVPRCQKNEARLSPVAHQLIITTLSGTTLPYKILRSHMHKSIRSCDHATSPVQNNTDSPWHHIFNDLDFFTPSNSHIPNHLGFRRPNQQICVQHKPDTTNIKNENTWMEEREIMPKSRRYSKVCSFVRKYGVNCHGRSLEAVTVKSRGVSLKRYRSADIRSNMLAKGSK